MSLQRKKKNLNVLCVCLFICEKVCVLLRALEWMEETEVRETKSAASCIPGVDKKKGLKVILRLRCCYPLASLYFQFNFLARF